MSSAPPENRSTPKFSLTDWQKAQLAEIDSDSGIRCLIKTWFADNTGMTEGSYCNATWDNHYCWPATPSGTIVKRNCSEVLQENHPQYASFLKGSAFRICQKNGTWLRGNWTNYTECADSYDEYVEQSIMQAEENELKEKVRYTVFIGSILSLLCLVGAITVFCCFRSIWCDRIILHLHLMAALTLRYILLYVITEPFIFNRTTNYRDDDWICKAILIMYLYATLSSVNWMFIQGIYLNSKLTTNVFDKEPPFKSYYTFGWIVPLPFMGIYSLLMEANHPVKCWKGYSQMTEIWIVLGPILIDLLINFGFLLNILRILLTKVNIAARNTGEFKHFRRAAKATIILSPILGINNLLFIYNPGGIYHKTFVLLNTFFGATQGVFVAVVYCFLSADVWGAVRRVYRRFRARHDANRCRHHQRRAESHSTSSAHNASETGIQQYADMGNSTGSMNISSSANDHLSPSPRKAKKLRVYRKEPRNNTNVDTEFSQMLLPNLPENMCGSHAHQHSVLSSKKFSVNIVDTRRTSQNCQDIPLRHLDLSTNGDIHNL